MKNKKAKIDNPVGSDAPSDSVWEKSGKDSWRKVAVKSTSPDSTKPKSTQETLREAKRSLQKNKGTVKAKTEKKKQGLKGKFPDSLPNPKNKPYYKGYEKNLDEVKKAVENVLNKKRK